MKASPPRLLTLATILALLASGCDSEEPKALPDWGEVERLLASSARKDHAEAVRRIMLADEDYPGTLVALAQMPRGDLPALRNYTAAELLVTLSAKSPDAAVRKAWRPSKGTLELLLSGLEDNRDLPLGGAADWDMPVARFCEDALELLTGRPTTPRPINVLPSRADAARWRAWWEEGNAYLLFDSERWAWQVDETAKRLGTPLQEP